MQTIHFQLSDFHRSLIRHMHMIRFSSEKISRDIYCKGSSIKYVRGETPIFRTHSPPVCTCTLLHYPPSPLCVCTHLLSLNIYPLIFINLRLVWLFLSKNSKELSLSFTHVREVWTQQFSTCLLLTLIRFCF